MQSRPFRFGPLALTNAAANLVNPGTTTGGVNATGSPYDKTTIILTHVRIINKTSSAHTFSGYVGATGASAAGTEWPWNGKSVPANDAVDWYGRMALSTSDFFVGLADANTSLVIQGEGEVMVMN